MSPPPTDDGLTSVEGRLLSAALAEVKQDLRDIRSTMDGVQRALESLVRIDTEQMNFRSSISRAFDDIKLEREKREKMDERIQKLEVDAPSYKELRRWVIGGVLTGIGALLAALFAIVFKVIISDPIEHHFQSPPHVPQQERAQ